MRSLILTVISLTLICLQTAEAAECGKSWRVAASYSRFTTSGAADDFGGALGGGFEYSFSRSLTPDEALPGDVSVALYYRRFDNTNESIDHTMGYGSLGLKWRGGAGAHPWSEGLYGGVEAAAAVLSIRPSIGERDSHEGITKFEWSIFGGANFARSFFIEFGYSSIGHVNGITLGAVNVMFGARF